jgi:hypothetical protein
MVSRPLKRFVLPFAVFVALFLALAAGSSSQPNGAIGKWAWDTGLPGGSTIANDLTLRAARFSGVNPATLRNVIAVENSEGERLTISAGYDGTGKTCFGYAQPGVARDFDCVDARIEDFTVLPYVSMGGRTLRSVDRAAVMGIVRNDVSRIELTLIDGSRRKLSLNRWRAFAYLATEGNAMPKTLTAYRDDGSVLQEVNVSVDPVCGGPAGPCPRRTRGPREER